MTIKQRAAVEVLKVILFAGLVGAATSILMQYVGVAVMGTIIAGAVFIYLIKTAYDIRVSQLEWERDRIERALKQTKD
jgi:hypothetical protein